MTIKADVKFARARVEQELEPQATEQAEEEAVLQREKVAGAGAAGKAATYDAAAGPSVRSPR